MKKIRNTLDCSLCSVKPGESLKVQKSETYELGHIFVMSLVQNVVVLTSFENTMC